jgi:hypothetical protein
MTPVKNWRDETRELLNNRPVWLEVRAIAEAVDVSPAWVRLFARGLIPDPGVMKVQALHKFLTEANNKKV